MTHAPASRALAAVSSTDPSSTTMISCHAAAPRRRDTTVPMVSASFIAGMTIDTMEESAKELLDDAVPRDRLRHALPGAAEARGERAIGGKPVDRCRERVCVRLADEPVDAVANEFERAAGIVRGDHGPGGEKRFERHVSVILVVGRVDHAERTCV